MDQFFKDMSIEKFVEFIKIVNNITFGFSLEDLSTGEKININADVPLPLMSTVKVPLMAEVFYQIKEGRLNLDDRLPMTNEMKVPPSGVLCFQEEREYSVKELLYLMISISDNTATDILLEKVGIENVRTRMREELGYKSFTMHTNVRGLWLMSFGRYEKLHSMRKEEIASEWTNLGYKEKRRFVEKVLEENRDRPFTKFEEGGPHNYDDLAFMANLVDNRCSTSEMNDLMKKILMGEVVGEESCKYMHHILGTQQCDDGLGFYFPWASIDYRNKTGGIWGGSADTGIIRLPRHPIVVTMQATNIPGAITMKVKKEIGILGEKIVEHYSNAPSTAPKDPSL